MTVSAIIPAYNAERWIARAIESVLSQTRPVDEIIVVDDGSTDKTAAVVAGFGERVHYIRQTNGGPAKARNTGMQAAAGEWLALLDADDWSLPRRIELELQAAEQNPGAVLVYGSLHMVDESGKQETRIAPPAEKLWPAMRYRNPIATSTVLVKRAALQQIGGFNQRQWTTEDWEAWVRLRQLGAFVCVAEPVVCYRVAADSLSGDAARIFRDFQPMLEETLIADLRGWRRTLWRRRILASQAYTAAKTARGSGDTGAARKFLWMSFCQW